MLPVAVLGFQGLEHFVRRQTVFFLGVRVSPQMVIDLFCNSCRAVGDGAVEVYAAVPLPWNDFLFRHFPTQLLVAWG